MANVQEAERDQERLAFIQDLDRANLEVSDWEAGFIGSVMKWDFSRGGFSAKMRAAIDKMQEKYANKVK